MTEGKDLQKAKRVFAAMTKALDSHEWHYEKNEDKLELKCGAQGDDLPIEITLKVDSERQLIMLLSHLPFTITEDKRLDVAVAISIINNKLVNGSFDYDIRTGHVFFRMTNSYIESELGSEAFTYMLFCSCQTIDEYNDKFLMISKNMLSLEQFIAND